MVKTEKNIYTLSSKPSLDEASITATKNMVHFLNQEYKLSEEKAMFLLSATGNLQICQVVDPLKTVRMELPLEYLK
jgi:amidase